MRKIISAMLSAVMMFTAAQGHAFTVLAEETPQEANVTEVREETPETDAGENPSEAVQNEEPGETAEEGSPQEPEVKEEEPAEEEAVTPEKTGETEEGEPEDSEASEKEIAEEEKADSEPSEEQEGSSEEEALPEEDREEGSEALAEPRGYRVKIYGNGGGEFTSTMYAETDGTIYQVINAEAHTLNFSRIVTDYEFQFASGYSLSQLLGLSANRNSAKPEYPIDRNGNVVLPANKKGTVSLYMIWGRYSLTMNANGGTFKADGSAEKKVSYTADDAYKIDFSANAVSRNGYHLSHWYSAKSGTRGTVINADVLASNPGKYSTAYAVWTPNTYTVTLNGNGGKVLKDASTGVASLSFEHTFDKAYAIKNKAVRSGYKFVGWSEDPKAAKPEYKPSGKYKHFSANGQNVTLYAVYTPIKYKVTQYSNGGTFEGDTKSKSSLTTTYTAESPASDFRLNITKAGYHFGGWFRDKALKQEIRKDLIANYLVTYPGQIKTLYAKWNPKTYQVVLDPNGGQVVDTKDGSKYNAITFEHVFGTSEKIAYKAEKPGTKRFLGWALTPDAKKAKFKTGSKYKQFSDTGDRVILYAVYQ